VFWICCQHQQQVAAAVERAKQVTMQELNAIIGVIQSPIFIESNKTNFYGANVSQAIGDA